MEATALFGDVMDMRKQAQDAKQLVCDDCKNSIPKGQAHEGIGITLCKSCNRAWDKKLELDRLYELELDERIERSEMFGQDFQDLED